MILSVVLPVKHEPGLMSFLHDLHTALIGTVGRDNYQILIQSENGLGKALASGISKSVGDYVLTMDADGQHDPRDIERLWRARDDAKIVIGGKSRECDSRSFFKRVASRAYYRYVRPKDFDVKDLGSNFRLYHGDHVRTLLKINRVSPTGRKFLQWILLEAVKDNAVVIEIPVRFLPRTAGKSKCSYRRELMERLIRKT